MSQPKLPFFPEDGPAPPYAKGSDTSLKAAQDIRPRVATLRHRIHIWVAARGSRGATSDEIEKGMGLTHQTCSARCKELRDGGQLKDSGRRRKTRSGRQAMVHVATGVNSG